MGDSRVEGVGLRVGVRVWGEPEGRAGEVMKSERKHLCHPVFPNEKSLFV